VLLAQCGERLSNERKERLHGRDADHTLDSIGSVAELGENLVQRPGRTLTNPRKRQTGIRECGAGGSTDQAGLAEDVLERRETTVNRRETQTQLARRGADAAVALHCIQISEVIPRKRLVGSTMHARRCLGRDSSRRLHSWILPFHLGLSI
jgi:hypothetical protein